jgi:hypothetical protein
MRAPNRSEAIAFAVVAALISAAAWIGVSEPVFGPAPVSVATEDPGRSQARLRVRVKAVEGRISSLEGEIEARSAQISKLEAALQAFDESEGD